MVPFSPTRFAATALGLVDGPPPARRGAPLFGTASSCWLCGGATGGRGWRQADAIAPTFTQFACAALPDSDAVCQPCVSLTKAEAFQRLVRSRGLDVKLWAQCGWHSYSHLVTGAGHYEAPKPDRIRAILLDPPEPPFLLGLNPSGQKHTLFRSRIALSRDLFPVHTEERTLTLDRARFAGVLAGLERMSALGFGREQSLSGDYHAESLRRAGLAAWRAGEAVLHPVRQAEPDLLALAAWVGRGPRWFADRHGTAREEAA